MIKNFVEIEGLEPSLTEPESVVLPLHHISIWPPFLNWDCKGMNVLLKCKTFCKKMNKTFYISPMKRLILVIIIFFTTVWGVWAQPKALGLRLGNDCQLSYEHNVGARTDFLEADLGMQFYYGYATGLNAAFAYNFMVAQPKWSENGQWGFYVGPAVKVGYVGVGGYVAVGAQVGLEYEFEFPLQLSIDIRPVVGISSEGGGVSVYGADAILGSLPCLSVRYRF